MPIVNSEDGEDFANEELKLVRAAHKTIQLVLLDMYDIEYADSDAVKEFLNDTLVALVDMEKEIDEKLDYFEEIKT